MILFRKAFYFFIKGGVLWKRLYTVQLPDDKAAFDVLSKNKNHYFRWLLHCGLRATEGGIRTSLKTAENNPWGVINKDQRIFPGTAFRHDSFFAWSLCWQSCWNNSDCVSIWFTFYLMPCGFPEEIKNCSETRGGKPNSRTVKQEESVPV